MYLGLCLLLMVLMVCWATGASRRLMRLREAASQRWAPLAETGQRLVSVMQATLPPAQAGQGLLGEGHERAEPSAPQAQGTAGPRQPAAPSMVAFSLQPVLPAFEGDDEASLLRGALMQYVVAMAAVQSRPWSDQTAEALAVAQELLWTLWQRRQQRLLQLIPDRLEPPLAAAEPPEPSSLALFCAMLLSQGQQAEAQYRLMAEQFNLCATQYNQAIHQFPALLLARVMGFQTVRLLQVPSSLTSIPS
jgi:hypothetical protein